MSEIHSSENTINKYNKIFDSKISENTSEYKRKYIVTFNNESYILDEDTFESMLKQYCRVYYNKFSSETNNTIYEFIPGLN